MNDTTELINTVASEPPKPKRRNKFWWLILPGIAGIVAVISYLGWQQFTQSQQDLQRQVKELQNQVTTLEGKFQALLSTEEKRTPSEQIEAQLLSFSKQLQQLGNQQNTLANQVRQPHPRDEDWIFAETMYLLTLAQYHLQFTQAVDNALPILKEAETNLESLNQPAVLDIRTKLVAKIRELSQAKMPPIDQLATRLTEFATLAQTLPLIQGSRHLVKSSATTSNQASPVADTWQDWVGVVWNQIKQLVVIRYNTEADRGLLSVEQREFVMHNLRLNLDLARVSLWRRDTHNFTASLQTARDWLTRYYDPNDSDVKKVQEDLAQMQTEVLTPKLPDVTEILQQLQQMVSNSTSQSESTETTP